MLKLLILYVHLLATCVALGMIVVSDLRLLGRLALYPAPMVPPTRFVTRVIGTALLVLYVSGGALILTGLDADGNFMNQKLQAKLLLVCLLTLNAIVLHRWTFPRLHSGGTISPFVLQDVTTVALPAAVSNALWLYCAFLGIARPWNDVMNLLSVLAIAAVLIVAFLGLALMVLTLASRNQRRHNPDWIDALKSRLGLVRTAFEG